MSESTGVVALFDDAKAFGFVVPEGISPNDRGRHCFRARSRRATLRTYYVAEGTARQLPNPGSDCDGINDRHSWNCSLDRKAA